MNEFSLIEQFFKPFPVKRKEVMFGIGDDAACLQIPKGNDLLVSTDTLVSGVHFLPEWDPYDIACKAAMVNISDMAAMAAEPCWATLALTLPELNQGWLEAFARGLSVSFNEFNVDLIGGDTTHGPLSITLTIMGLAPHSQSIRRNGAQPGDIILVSGPLGAAALAVKLLTNHNISATDKAELMNKLLHPKPRVDLISMLRSYASSAIDISDGLSADLNHLCVASGVGACLTKEALPIHRLLPTYCGDEAINLALTGGDDYELCFTVSPRVLDSLIKECHKANLVCYPIGVIEDRPGLRMQAADKACEELRPAGYSHF
ncbi:thiamine-phosphate kinase [Legionella maioricensis]|uniref:Thiamine-monophosphate kinase n=1 Tax=Legionella maioricensis TaxID=2896528 RepID=A0A9X2D318_9GAMM|nr:thiamine-phosphate kinase [Legionella maioricensis]MCL9685516.1 thiamine-phosphate kinase [Legionella maioricensis]MCL9688870.1 thiamine-phosphate kinase [Legionella maioricensis]